MTEEEDYVLVRGDFETRSDNNHENKLTAGTLEVKGIYEEGWCEC